MEFNGTNVADLKMFDNIDLSSLPEELDQTPINNATRSEMIQANIIANIPQRFAESTFNDIEKELADKVKPFCLNPKTDNVFILFGNVGRGKTTTMSAALHERKIHGMDCGLYYSIHMLSPTLRTCRSYSARENEEAFLIRLSTVSFLCLDEVGTCFNKTEEREFLTTILSARFDNCLPTMIATNLSPYEFKYLIAGVTPDGTEDQKSLCARLDVENPVLNRIKSVAITHKLMGESFRTRG